MTGLNGVRIILIGREIGVIRLPVLHPVKLAIGKTNFVKRHQDGTTFYPKSRKPQVLTSAKSKYARKKRNKGDAISGIGSMSSRQLKRKKPINSDSMVDIKPLTDNQERFFKSYKEGKNLFAYGAAGTGKTFIALYLALRDVLDQFTPYEKVYVVRSLVATREIGFLPEIMRTNLLSIRFHTRTW